MYCKVTFSHGDKGRTRQRSMWVREGTIVYQHPEGRFVVVEFQGKNGSFRESFWPEEVEAGVRI